MNNTIKNLTPHVINIVNSETFEIIQSIPSENSQPLRVTETKQLLYTINGIDVYKTVYGKCEQLPLQEENTFLIVSRIVIDAHPDRDDLLTTSGIIRKDSDGQFSSHPFAKGDIFGCLSLSR